MTLPIYRNARASSFRKIHLRALLDARKITRKRYAELRRADRIYRKELARGIWDYNGPD